MICLIHCDGEDQQTFTAERGHINKILDYSSGKDVVNLITVYTLCCKGINLNYVVNKDALADDLGWTEDKVQHCLNRLKNLEIIGEK